MKTALSQLGLCAGVICCLAFVSSCTMPRERTDDRPSPFTHGQVQLTLEKGVTTQNEVLETFGPPNIATRDSLGNEVWTYQKHATVSESSRSDVYGTVILFGAQRGTSGFEQSSRTMTLIIKFDDENKITDFSSMTTSF